MHSVIDNCMPVGDQTQDGNGRGRPARWTVLVDDQDGREQAEVIPKEISEALLEIEKYTGYLDRENHASRIEKLKSKVLAYDSSLARGVEEAQKKGMRWREVRTEFQQLGSKYPRLHRKVLAAFDSLAEELSALGHAERNWCRRLVAQAERSFQKAAKRRENFENDRLEETSEYLGLRVIGHDNGVPFIASGLANLVDICPATPVPAPSTLPSSTGNRIDRLQHSDSWQLFVDESGTEFGSGSPNADPSQLGRIVGVLVPFGRDGKPAVNLPPLRWGFHANAERVREVDQAVQHLLSAPIGVLGLTAAQLPPFGDGDRWVASVLEAIYWVLTLLPVEGATSVIANIEEREPHGRNEVWTAAAAELQRSMVAMRPELSALSLSIRVVGKDASPYLAYADALAYTWGSSRMASQERLHQSGLLDSCLIEKVGVETLRNAKRLMAMGGSLDAELWTNLLSSVARGSDAVTARILQNTAEHCRRNPNRWAQYLDSANIRNGQSYSELDLLARQVEWLEDTAPLEAQLTGVRRLRWALIKLICANRHGDLGDPKQNEIDPLRARLFDEEPRILCQYDTELALNAIHREEFGEAAHRLAPWLRMPLAVAGRENTAQCCVTLGHNYGVQGDFARARLWLRKAMAMQQGSADREMRVATQYQTQVALSLIDLTDPALQLQEKRQSVEELLGASIGEATESLAGTGVNEVGRHRVLLRYLAFFGTAAETKSYLQTEPTWARTTVRPWAGIEWYRGILLGNAGRNEAKDYWEAAWRITADDGLTRREGLAAVVRHALVFPRRLAELEPYLADLVVEVQAMPQSSHRLQMFLDALRSGPRTLSLLSRALCYDLY